MSNLPLRSLASTNVKIIFADVLQCFNAAKVESDVLYCASLADPCEMESLIVRAHNGHCCVSVGLLAVLHLHTR